MTLASNDVKMRVDESVELGPIHLQPTKSSIIDQELNQHGMGRYQWLIWAMCGTGFFLDDMWAQALALALPNIQRELGFSDKGLGCLSSVVIAGVTMGAFVWGVLIDVVGRRVAFLGTSLIAGVFGMCLGAMSSFNGLLAMAAFAGFGIGGNIPVDSTITVEYLPADRFYLLAALSIFQPPAVMISTLIAFGLIPNYSCSTQLVSCHLTGGAEPCCSRDGNMGWRYLFFTISSITLGIFVIRFFIFPFYESPRFLLSKGQDRAAVEVVHKIAAFNERSCDLTVESLYERCKETPVAEEIGFSKRLVREILRLKLLFGSWRMVRITILVWITWMFDYWGLVISDTYLPTILQRKNGATNVSLEQTYVDYLIIYAPGMAAVILSVLMVRTPLIGRKWALVSSSMIMGVSLLFYSIVNSRASRVGFSMLEYFCQCLFNATLFGWTPEAFPAAVRGTATGIASCLGSIFGICSSQIAAQLFSSTSGSNAVLYLGASGVFVCTICLLCIPTKDMVAPR